MKKFLIWLAIFIVSFFLFGVIGQFVGSLVFIRFTKVSMDPGIFVLWDLYNTSQDGGIWALLQYKVAVGISGVITLAPVIVGFATLFSRPKRELHGSARFARAGEIARAGLLKDSHTEPDMIIGKYKNRYLRWAGKQFAFLAAPTRSGKGVGIVIPNCLHYRDSLVVFDPKLENFEITAGYRAANGQQVFLFNPSTKDFTSHRWNPLSYIKRDRHFAPGGAFSIANILYPTSGKMEGNTRFFNEMAQKLFVGLCLYLIETEEETGTTPTLSAMLQLSTPATGEPLADWIKKAVEDPELSRECKSNLLSYAGNTGATASGIVSSFLAPLSVFSDPMVAAVTSGDDFDLRQVRRQRMTIYVGILPNDISRFSRLINLFFSQLISENTDQLPNQNPALRYQCLLLLDEFAALGRVDIIESGVAYIAGYNLRLLAIFQNLAQLNGLYGVDGARTLTTNFECQIIFTPRDNKDAQEYSEIIGYETFKSRSTSRSSGKSSSNSQSYSDQRRSVMLPQEVKTMPHEECIINLSGLQTIHADKVFYYKDKVFLPRLGYARPQIPRIGSAVRNNRQWEESGGAEAGALEMIPEQELDDVPLETVANKDQLMQSVIAGLCAQDSPPQYLADLKKAVAKAWQDSGSPVIEQIKLNKPIIRNFVVFNAEQITGLPPLVSTPHQWEGVEQIDKLLAASGAHIEHRSGNKAYYSPGQDKIVMPLKEQFSDPERYYSTALHELGHWTGHESRLNRPFINAFGSEGYAREELRAEISSMLIGQRLGISHDPGQHMAYVDAWVKILKEDPAEIVRACQDAEKINNYLSVYLEQTSEKPDLVTAGRSGTIQETAQDIFREKLPKLSNSEQERFKNMETMMLDVVKHLPIDSRQTALASFYQEQIRSIEHAGQHSEEVETGR